MRLLLCFFLLSGWLMAEEVKGVERVQHEPPSHIVGDGFYVYNYFTSQSAHIQDLSPFLLLDYNAPYNFAPSANPRGVGGHPHRGFETVTIVYEGALAHRDSTGAGGVIRAGDVQWMTAASGILHEEFHEKSFSEKGGVLHAVQLWVNLSAKEKMFPPKYQTLLKQDIPTLNLDGKTVRVIAGHYAGVQGAASTFTPINVLDIRLHKGSEFSMDVPLSHNALLLITQGAILVNGVQTNFKDLVQFSHEGSTINLKATEESMALLLTGAPLHEPIVGDGPFVMNTRQEIRQAYKDFNDGRWGTLD